MKRININMSIPYLRGTR